MIRKRSVDIAVPCGCVLGEGPVWQSADQRLLWVDIRDPAIFTFVPTTGNVSRHPMPEAVGFVLPFQGGSYIAGMKSGLAQVALGDAIVPLPTAGVLASGDRINDGWADPHGRLWFGTMHEQETEATGYFWLRHHDGSIHRQAGPYVVTNGPAFSRDGRLIYTVDSVCRRIWRAVLDTDGNMQAASLFVSIPEAWGYPDGIVVDSADHLWVALWGGSAVVRYSPQAEMVERIELPVSQVTKCAFGGPDRAQLFITSAAFRRDRTAEPLAGHVFVVDVDVPGPDRDPHIL